MKRLLLLCSLLALVACAQPAPPPPVATAPPPPPPPPQTTFTVFFPWDSATLTPEGAQIVQAAATNFKAGAPSTVQVTGYTDTSGSPAYNQQLSERRAQSVASDLGQQGVPQSALVITGQGQNDLRVPTPPGVREPQNRRVEIVEGGAGAPPTGAPPPPPAGAPPPPPPGS
ncbi:MAG: OmpA family protein [Stellaceae bacterium]